MAYSKVSGRGNSKKPAEIDRNPAKVSLRDGRWPSTDSDLLFLGKDNTRCLGKKHRKGAVKKDPSEFVL